MHNLLCRHFELRLSPRRGLFASNFKAFTVNQNNQRSEFTLDKNNFLEGIVIGKTLILNDNAFDKAGVRLIFRSCKNASDALYDFC